MSFEENVYAEIYIFAIVISILFYISANMKLQTQIAVIIFIGITVLSWFYLRQLSIGRNDITQNVINRFDSDIAERKETYDNIFPLTKFPKKLKFLKENKQFIDLMENIRFVIRFDKSRYCDLLNNLNLLMKIYIYVLADRYDPELYIPQFVDVRDNITDMLYSLIMVVPSKFKHIYGVAPHDDIETSIEMFLVKSMEMLETMQRFSKIHKNINYIADSRYKPYNQIRQLYF